MFVLTLESSTASAKALLYNTETREYEIKTQAYATQEKDASLHDAQAVFEDVISVGRELCRGKLTTI